MQITHELIIVAFVRSVGGRIRLLLAVDRAGVPVADGEPLLLFEHRPGVHPATAVMEGPERLAQPIVDGICASAAAELAQHIEAAFDTAGQFRGDRLLGVSVSVDLADDSFAM